MDYQKDREIDLRDLYRNIIKKWRFIFMVVAISMLVVGTMGYYLSARYVDALTGVVVNDNEGVPEYTKYEETLTNIQIEEVKMFVETFLAYEEKYAQLTNDEKAKDANLVSFKDILMIDSVLTPDQKAYAAILKEQYYDKSDEKKEKNEMRVVIERRVDPYYFIFGALLGLIFSISIVCISYNMSCKIKSSNELRNMYKISILGSAKDAKTGMNSFTWTLLDKGLNVKKESDLEKKQLEWVCTNIIIKAEKAKVSRVLITGSYIDEESVTFRKRIINELKNMSDSLEVDYNDTSLDDPKSLRNIASYESIIIVEKVGCSEYSGISNLLEIAEDYGIDVLGAVVI
nr:hypothetical protein [uncultured Butyrivibrio sp.]